jgi:large subunit ribosomal protein L24
MNKIKKSDEVIVIAGRDKGRKGTVLEVLTDTDELIVDGINTVKKHVKANPDAGEKGGIIIKSMPIRRSKVMLYDPATEKGSKVGIKKLKDGSRVRYYKATGEVVDVNV